MLRKIEWVCYRICSKYCEYEMMYEYMSGRVSEKKCKRSLCDSIKDGESKRAEYYPLTIGEKVQYGGITALTRHTKLPKEEPNDLCTCEEDGSKEYSTRAVDKVGDSASEWMKSICRRGLRPILKDFASVRKFIPPKITTIMFDRYPAKNRYTDVMCLDKTRVVLKDRPRNNDYIHANWVQLSTNKRYICTQGPLEETIEDFWWMIFKEEVQAIVMLCDFIEDGESKCAEYYPLTIGEKVQYGGITVKNERDGKNLEEITCHMMSVRLEGDKHQVYHYRWSSWPDRSSPRSGAPLIALIMKLKTIQEKGPIVVHCSAGIGRTGTFCAVDYAIDRLNEEGTVSAPDVIKEIRQQRLHSVQSVLQYLYMHICLLEYMQIAKSLPQDIFTRRFRRDYEKYLKRFNEHLAKDKQQQQQQQQQTPHSDNS
ncbi:Protein-tyrosine phosphatase [Dirofilaria immitis]|nr:Protein-tyrosine phosphatase [Dirofilaria immitis]